MKKTKISLALAILMLISGCHAGSIGNKKQTDSQASQNHIQINMNLEAGKMDVIADYRKKKSPVRALC